MSKLTRASFDPDEFRDPDAAAPEGVADWAVGRAGDVIPGGAGEACAAMIAGVTYARLSNVSPVSPGTLYDPVADPAADFTARPARLGRPAYPLVRVSLQCAKLYARYLLSRNPAVLRHANRELT